MGYNKFMKESGEVLLDLMNDTVAPEKLVKGVTAHDNTGALIEGTLELPKGNIDITENGTHDVTAFENAVVNVPVPEDYVVASAVEGVSGIWVIQDDFSGPETTMVERVNFTSYRDGNLVNLVGMAINGTTNKFITYIDEFRSSGGYGGWAGYYKGSWTSENTNTVNFGDVPQSVSPEFYLWLISNAKKQGVDSPLVAATVAYDGELISTIEYGETKTIACAGKKMTSDVTVTAAAAKKDPVFQEKTVTENGEVVADEGFDGLSKVTVEVPIPEGYVKPEGSLEINANGTHDVPNYAEVVVNVPNEQPQLYTPNIAISEDGVLTIYDNENNGAFTSHFDIYIDGEVVTTIEAGEA